MEDRIGPKMELWGTPPTNLKKSNFLTLCIDRWRQNVQLMGSIFVMSEESVAVVPNLLQLKAHF